MTTRKEQLESVLQVLAPTHLSIEDQSAAHEGHLESGDGETHFSLVIVSEKFGGLSKIARHRLIHHHLKEQWETADGLHALTIKAWTPDEFAELTK